MAKKLIGMHLFVNPRENVYLLNLGMPANIVRVEPPEDFSGDMFKVGFLVDP